MTRILKQRQNVVCRRIAGEAVLVPVQGQLSAMRRIYALNDTAEFVWSRLDGQHSLAQVAQAMGDRFDVDGEVAARDVAAVADEFEREDLVEKAGAA